MNEPTEGQLNAGSYHSQVSKYLLSVSLIFDNHGRRTEVAIQE